MRYEGMKNTKLFMTMREVQWGSGLGCFRVAVVQDKWTWEIRDADAGL